MTFADIVAALSKELGTGIETEGDVCAIRAGGEDGTAATVILHGLDECGGVLLAADLGEPPSEGRDRLLRVLLEANDLFRDTAGATLSLDPDRRAARGVAKRVENHEWTRMDGNVRDLHENKERRFAGKKKRQGPACRGRFQCSPKVAFNGFQCSQSLRPRAFVRDPGQNKSECVPIRMKWISVGVDL